MKLKYALIGCGRISPNHITAAINNNLEIVGLCDLEINKVNFRRLNERRRPRRSCRRHIKSQAGL